MLGPNYAVAVTWRPQTGFEKKDFFLESRMTSRLFAMLPTRTLLVGMLIVGTFGGCGLTEPDGSPGAMLEFTRRHDQWTRKNIVDYRYDYNAMAFASVPPVRIEVANGAVVRVVDLATGATLPNSPSFPTIDGLFTTAAQVLRSDMYDSHIEYDGTFGFPTLIDASSQLPDAGFSVTARNFEQPGRLFSLPH